MIYCEESKEYVIINKFKVCCHVCDTVYNLIIEDDKQIHQAIVECKCGNTIKI